MLVRRKHTNANGVKLKSKSEIIIEQRFIAYGLSYEYEKPLENCPSIPDFTITYGGKVWIWEHLGGLDYPNYSKRWDKKKRWYQQNGYWDSVVISQDHKGSIDVREIDTAIRKIIGSAIDNSAAIDKISDRKESFGMNTVKIGATHAPCKTDNNALELRVYIDKVTLSNIGFSGKRFKFDRFEINGNKFSYHWRPDPEGYIFRVDTDTYMVLKDHSKTNELFLTAITESCGEMESLKSTPALFKREGTGFYLVADRNAICSRRGNRRCRTGSSTQTTANHIEDSPTEDNSVGNYIPEIIFDLPNETPKVEEVVAAADSMANPDASLTRNDNRTIRMLELVNDPELQKRLIDRLEGDPLAAAEQIENITVRHLLIQYLLDQEETESASA